MSLLQEIERHLKRTGISPSRFGREAMRDPAFVHDLRAGRQPGEAVTRRVRAYLVEAAR